jgi:hypothetical protein
MNPAGPMVLWSVRKGQIDSSANPKGHHPVNPVHPVWIPLVKEVELGALRDRLETGLTGWTGCRGEGRRKNAE